MGGGKAAGGDSRGTALGEGTSHCGGGREGDGRRGGGPRGGGSGRGGQRGGRGPLRPYPVRARPLVSPWSPAHAQRAAPPPPWRSRAEVGREAPPRAAILGRPRRERRRAPPSWSRARETLPAAISGGAPSYTAKRGASARRHLGSGQRSPFALPAAPSPASPHCGVQDPLSTPPTPSPRPPLVEPHGGPHPPSSLRPPRVPPCCVKEASARNHTLLRRCRHPPLPNPSILSPTPQNPHPHPTPSVPPSPHSTQCSPAVPSALCLGLVPPSWPRLRPCGAAMQLWGRSSRGLIGAFWKGRGCGGALGGALGISPPP